VLNAIFNLNKTKIIKMKKRCLVFLIIAFMITGPLFAQNTNGASKNVKHHVIMEITSADTSAWKGAMNNIRHLKEKWNADVDIEIVAHGPGVDMLVKEKTNQQKQMTELKNAGVRFAACMNSMKARNISKEALVSEAEPVPSGVVEVITKQEDGWSYLKSGF
jgi:uncharacterized protein